MLTDSKRKKEGSTSLLNESYLRTGGDLPVDVQAWVLRYRNDWGFEARQPTDPTDSEVGSPHRIEIYRQRVEAGQPIFVAGDRRGNRPALAYSAPALGYGIKIDGDARRGCAYDDLYQFRYSRWYRFKRAAGRHVIFVGFQPCDEFDKQAAAWCVFQQMNACTVVNLYGARKPIVSGDASAYLRSLQARIDEIDEQLEHSDDQSLMNLSIEIEDQLEEAQQSLQVELDKQADIIGPLNDLVIRDVVSSASIVILAWGGRPEMHCPEVQERAARLAYALRRQCEIGVLRVFGISNGQPTGIQRRQAIEAPLIDGEIELRKEDE